MKTQSKIKKRSASRTAARVGSGAMVRPSSVLRFDVQRLRSLTTGRLHTEIGHIYEDLGLITGEIRLMTHMLPRAMRACEPWLREHVTDARFWDGAFDQGHTGTIELPMPTEDERKAMSERYAAQPNPLAGKTVIGVQV